MCRSTLCGILFITNSLYTLVGIYPTSVGAISMDTTGNGDVVNFTAQIAYQYWEKTLPSAVPTVPATPRTIGSVTGIVAP